VVFNTLVKKKMTVNFPIKLFIISTYSYYSKKEEVCSLEVYKFKHVGGIKYFREKKITL